jgi:hypothetical protein
MDDFFVRRTHTNSLYPILKWWILRIVFGIVRLIFLPNESFDTLTTVFDDFLEDWTGTVVCDWIPMNRTLNIEILGN